MALLRALRSPDYQANNAADERFWAPSEGGYSASGVTIGADSALKASAVYACVRLIAESVASLPLIVYQRLPNGGKQRASQHPLYELLHDSPCDHPRQTAFQFVSTSMAHLLLRGNAYARILPGRRGAVDQLKLIHPDRVRPEIVGDDILRYQIRNVRNGREEPVNAEDIFHLTGLSLDGITGVSVITYARETIGLALAAEGYASRVFSQDATPRGVIKLKGRLSSESLERMRAQWGERHSGPAGQHRPAVLEEDADFKAISMTAEDAQLVYSREFQTIDIARFFNVPLHMIQENSKATSWGTGIEQLSVGFVTYTLLPWTRRWEDTISQQLITNNRVFFAEFLFTALLRGNIKDRYEAYAIGRQNGWLTVDDILRFENMNPVGGPEGSSRLQPLNYAPLGTIPPPQPAPLPAPAKERPQNGAYHDDTPGAALLKELVHGND